MYQRPEQEGEGECPEGDAECFLFVHVVELQSHVQSSYVHPAPAPAIVADVGLVRIIL